MKISKKRFQQILKEEFDKVLEADKNYNTTQWKDGEGNYYSILQDQEGKWGIMKSPRGDQSRVEVLKDQDGDALTFPDDGSAAVFLDNKGTREDKINTF